jgi:antitoxin VapB
MSTRAKLFWNGRSQAVRLPKEFRFSGDEVLIRRADDKVILEPVHKGWDDSFWACFGKLSDDVERTEFVASERREDAFP